INFFFQAEDGIRDKLVTGVQTCALPILLADFPDFVSDPFTIARTSNTFAVAVDGNQLYVADASQNLVRKVDTTTGAFSTLKTFRSEERRVGKECRVRWWPYQ